MAIVWKLKDDGAFVCVDTERRVSAYAYPTSTYATLAKKRPGDVAAAMLCTEHRQVEISDLTREINQRHDRRIEELTREAAVVPAGTVAHAQ